MCSSEDPPQRAGARHIYFASTLTGTSHIHSDNLENLQGLSALLAFAQGCNAPSAMRIAQLSFGELSKLGRGERHENKVWCPGWRHRRGDDGSGWPGDGWLR